MWTAAADPHVIRARVLPCSDPAVAIDLTRMNCHYWHSYGCRHVRIDLPNGGIRLDLVEGELTSGELRIEPAIELLRPLEPQFASVRRLHELCSGEISSAHDQRLVRLVEALRAGDALAGGASLRDIALGILGDDWPGDGEHLKSRARRRVALAIALTRTGPRGVLNGHV
jgi:hypothetical protein